MIDVLLKFNWTHVSVIYVRNAYSESGIAKFQSLAGQQSICIDLDLGINDDYNISDLISIVDSLVQSSANVVVIFGTESTARLILSRIANTTSATRFTWIASDGCMC